MDEGSGGIAAEAARWYARLQAPDCTDADRAAFEAWIASDPRHAQAFDLALRVADLAGRRPLRRRTAGVAQARRWPAALAASLVLAVAAAAWFGASRTSPGGGAPVVLANAGRALQRHELADGTTVHLDIGARAVVAFEDDARRVDLTSGRALFDVARDPARPFSVHAGGTVTVALGTTFQVDVASAVQVVLAEGAVRVTGGGDSPWSVDLEPGTALQWDAARDEAPRRMTLDVAAATAWTAGRHNFRDAPLRQVLEELNRYGERRLVLGDPRLADLAVGGSFVAGDARLTAATLEAVLPIRAEERGDEIVLIPR